MRITLEGTICLHYHRITKMVHTYCPQFCFSAYLWSCILYSVILNPQILEKTFCGLLYAIMAYFVMSIISGAVVSWPRSLKQTRLFRNLYYRKFGWAIILSVFVEKLRFCGNTDMVFELYVEWKKLDKVFSRVYE